MFHVLSIYVLEVPIQGLVVGPTDVRRTGEMGVGKGLGPSKENDR